MNRLRKASAIMAALLCLMASACTGQKRMTGYNNPASVNAPSVLIAYYDASVGKGPLLDAVKAQHAEVIYDYKNINAVAIRVSDGRSAEQIIKSLEKVKGVLSVAKDGKQTLHQAG